MLTKSLLEKEIRQWSEEVLESPNKDFNNMPACPFAKQSWNSGRVQVVLGEGGLWEDLVDLIKNFDDTYDVIVYCGTDYDEISAEEFEDRLDILTEVSVPKDIWIMGTHPDADDIPHAVNQDHFEALTEDNYYQRIFSKYYPDRSYLVPYQWLPKWTNEKNPSGRLIL